MDIERLQSLDQILGEEVGNKNCQGTKEAHTKEGTRRGGSKQNRDSNLHNMGTWHGEGVTHFQQTDRHATW
jgi:hypothetical protein